MSGKHVEKTKKSKAQIIDALIAADITPPFSIDVKTVALIISQNTVTFKQIGLFFYHLGLISSAHISDTSPRISWGKKLVDEIIITDGDKESDDPSDTTVDKS